MDRNIQVFVGPQRTSQNWSNKKTTWITFITNKLADPVKSSETLAEFGKMPKSKQVELKDVGGFVGGPCSGSLRKKDAVLGRDLLTLDLDNVPGGLTDSILSKIELLNIEAVVYTTRNHRKSKPRLRIIIPTTRTIEPEMYEPLARVIAKRAGLIDYCDPTTFQNNRMMFYPSICSDSDWLYRHFESDTMLNPDMMLADFNWKDCSLWPLVSGEIAKRERTAVAQQDPETKTGWVGAFCRCYNIDSAIETFIPHIYTKCGDNRYTYCQGSTFGGAVTYQNGKFMYSHHATDPSHDILCNSFDLIRIHLFGELDKDCADDVPTEKRPSYKEMCRKCTEDRNVSALFATEQANNIRIAFNNEELPQWRLSPEDERNLGGRNKNGGFATTVANFKYIMDNDPRLRSHIAYDEFIGQMVAKNGLPIAPGDTGDTRRWKDEDDARLFMFFEEAYSMKCERSLLKATLIVADENKYNSVKEYLEGLVWDGTNRIDDALHVYLGAQKREYEKQVLQRILVGAIGRAIVGGTQWDSTPILVGPQGIGKSTFLLRLGKQWFSDSLQSFDGKDASELLQGIWINELPELSAFSKSEINRIKQFLTKRFDIYRESYGRRTKTHARRCVFIGTTNDDEFLRDPTGDRRYWPVRLDGDAELPISAFTDEVADQIWAEAYQLYKSGTIGYALTGEAEETARIEQKRHHVTDDWEGIITAYLETPVPDDWSKRDLPLRQAYLNSDTKDGANQIKAVSIIEIWCEAFNGDKARLNRVDRMRIAAIMRNLKGWHPGNMMRTRYAGVQRAYVREDN